MTDQILLKPIQFGVWRYISGKKVLLVIWRSRLSCLDFSALTDWTRKPSLLPPFSPFLPPSNSMAALFFSLCFSGFFPAGKAFCLGNKGHKQWPILSFPSNTWKLCCSFSSMIKLIYPTFWIGIKARNLTYWFPIFNRDTFGGLFVCFFPVVGKCSCYANKCSKMHDLVFCFFNFKLTWN